MHFALRIFIRGLFVTTAALLLPRLSAVPSPQIGAEAPNFTLKTLDDRPIELKRLTEKHSVVLVVLRGWPGYQCPLCSLQVHDFVSRASDFAKRNIQVLMVYPGPADLLKAHAQEFLQDKQWPTNFLYVIDPDYTFTNAYGLRWDEPKETAYPSTFIIDRENHIRSMHMTKSHGDRVSAQSALDALARMK